MLSEKCFVVFYAFSFSPLNLITSIPGLSILTVLFITNGAVDNIILMCYCFTEGHKVDWLF